MSNPHTIRINPKKEKELHEFFQAKGFKAGIKFLFDFYKNNQNIVDDIVDRLKDMDFAPKTKIQPKRLDTSFNHDDNFTNNF